MQAADRDDDRINIPADALALDGGTITAADGVTGADLTHAAVATERGHRMNGSLISPPAVKRIHFTYSAGEG